MRAALRLADARLAHSEPSNLLRLHLPTSVATDCASGIPPTNKRSSCPLLSGCLIWRARLASEL
eukprot:13508726-Alexandrium_andersonii.AAC.1